jgi:hypothetical protein
MKQSPDDQPLTPEQLLRRMLADLAELHASLDTPSERELAGQAGMALTCLRDLLRGAEPAWVQDIRLAQRLIDHERARLRADQSSDSAEA